MSLNNNNKISISIHSMVKYVHSFHQVQRNLYLARQRKENNIRKRMESTLGNGWNRLQVLFSFDLVDQTRRTVKQYSTVLQFQSNQPNRPNQPSQPNCLSQQNSYQRISTSSTYFKTVGKVFYNCNKTPQGRLKWYKLVLHVHCDYGPPKHILVESCVF